MAETQWEKKLVLEKHTAVQRVGRWKFLIAGIVILAAVAYLLLTSTGARYYKTVEELLNDPEMLGKTARVAGAVDGDPVFDPDTNTLTFIVANIPNDNDSIREQGGLPMVLHNAVEDPDNIRMTVVAHDKEIPDLLKHEAQAIMSGKLAQENGEYIFYADEITLKCPTRYEEDVPDQASG